MTITIAGGQLTNVTESANVDFGYKGQGSGFSYGEGGRLLSASGRGILEISYFDKVEMPSFIHTVDGSIEFFYDAEGRKWGQKTTSLNPPSNAPAVEEKIYINGLEIVNDQLSAFNHEYGRLGFDAEGVPSHEEYFVADHLGNVRVYFADLDGNGEVERNDEEVFQAKSYYPFVQGVTCHSHVALARPNPDQLSVGRMEIEGFEHHDYSLPRQPYSYNGKEELLGGLIAYEARLYDPWVGRFTDVDPIADQFPHLSVYNYAENRVPNAIDLHGFQAVLQVNIKQGNSTTSYEVNLNDPNVDASNTTYADQGKYGTRGTLKVDHNLNDGSAPQKDFKIGVVDRVMNWLESFDNNQSYGEVHSSDSGGNMEVTTADDSQKGVEVDPILRAANSFNSALGPMNKSGSSPGIGQSLDLADFLSEAPKLGMDIHDDIQDTKEDIATDSFLSRVFKPNLIIETFVPRENNDDEE